MFKILKVLFFVLLLSACGTTYNHDSKSWQYNPDCVANRKDGNDRKCSSQDWNYVPDTNTKASYLRISGTVICGKYFSEVPVNHATIHLKNGIKIISSAFTDSDGHFLVLGSLNPSLSYSIQIQSSCGAIEKELPMGLKENYVIEEIKLE